MSFEVFENYDTCVSEGKMDGGLSGMGLYVGLFFGVKDLDRFE